MRLKLNFTCKLGTIGLLNCAEREENEIKKIRSTTKVNVLQNASLAVTLPSTRTRLAFLPRFSKNKLQSPDQLSRTVAP